MTRTVGVQTLRIAALLLIALFLADATAAIRASPAEIVLVQGTAGTFTVRVLDTADPTQVTARVAGDLAPYMELDPPAAGGDGTVHITGRLRIPDGAAPGDHVQEMILAFAPAPDEGTVSARAEVAVRLIARVPYPDAYLTANWDVQQDQGAGASRITVTLENRGRVPVTPARITIGFADGAITLPDIGLPTGTIPPGGLLRGETMYVPPTDALPGVYLATLRVPYADTELAEMREVPVGAPRLTLDEVAYDEAETGAIIPIDVSGVVVWNRPLAGALTIHVDDQATPVLSQDISLAGGPYAQRVYLDTTVIGRPQRSVRTTLTIGDLAAERTIGISATPPVAALGVPVLIIALATLIVILIAAILLRRWRKAMRPPSQPPGPSMGSTQGPAQ